MAFLGLVLYSVVNVVSFLAVVNVLTNHPAMPATYAVILAVGALGGGALLLLLRRPWAKGLGLGLMIGWALWSIFSAGICTGLNPSIYA
ncbi:hypothetical protein J5X84_07755 [Streptosporangiaceae bacterium NEAU-GS5]|nr:hypothetical protein [Streptosporangiaceae bacterium NEAU-GS5]